MRLKERIERLELLQKQVDCNHTFIILTIEEYGNKADITSVCKSCDKKTSRTVYGNKIMEAVKLLRGQFGTGDFGTGDNY